MKKKRKIKKGKPKPIFSRQMEYARMRHNQKCERARLRNEKKRNAKKVLEKMELSLENHASDTK